MITRPLKGEKFVLEKVVYPVLATPKLDGIRALMIGGKLLSSTFKPIPNKFVRDTLEPILPDGIDGELMLYFNDLCQEVVSGVMSVEGEPDFYFAAFDYVKDSLDKPYNKRIHDLIEYRRCLTDKQRRRVKGILPVKIIDEQVLNAFEDDMLGEGYEGIMIRHPNGPYKCGRSTVREGILLKIKRFHDAEAKIIGFEEQQKNTNKKEKDELGLTKRSHSKKGKVGKGTLGKLLCVLDTGVEFRIGGGDSMDNKLRKQIWGARKTYINQYITFTYQNWLPSGKPRSPNFKCFRRDI